MTLLLSEPRYKIEAKVPALFSRSVDFKIFGVAIFARAEQNCYSG